MREKSNKFTDFIQHKRETYATRFWFLLKDKLHRNLSFLIDQLVTITLKMIIVGKFMISSTDKSKIIITYFYLCRILDSLNKDRL